MIVALKIVITILLVFNALGLACALAIALRRDAGIGRRSSPGPADPFFYPIGDMPTLEQRFIRRLPRKESALLYGEGKTRTGFTAEQLRAIARGSEESIRRDPLRRSFAVRDQLKREAQPLLRIRQSESGGLALHQPDPGGMGFLSSPRPDAVRSIFSRLSRMLKRGPRHA